MIEDSTSKGDPQSLINTRKRHESVQSLIGQLEQKLSGVRGNIEKEFLSAYRVHMLTVQSELKSLKLQVSRAEDALNDDGLIAKLEKEVNWFSEESGRLKMHAASMRKDMHHIVSRIEELKEQRFFLAEQLKAILKRSKVMEMELGYMTTQNETMNFTGVTTMMGRTGGPNSAGLSGFEDGDGGGGFKLDIIDGFDFSSTPADNTNTAAVGFAATNAVGAARNTIAALKDPRKLRISASAPVLPTAGVGGNVLRTAPTAKAKVSLTPLSATGTAGMKRSSSQQTSSKGRRSRSPKAVLRGSISPSRISGGDTDTLLNAKPKPSRAKRYLNAGFGSEHLKASRQLEKMIASRVPEEAILERVVLDQFKDIMRRRAQVLARDTNTNANVTRSKGGGGGGGGGINNNKKSNKIKNAYSSGYPGGALGGEEEEEEDEDEYYGHDRNVTGIDQAPAAVAGELDEAQLQKIGGVTGLGLEHFTDLDRYNVMVDFVSDPLVFEKVIQVLATDFASEDPYDGLSGTL